MVTFRVKDATAYDHDNNRVVVCQRVGTSGLVHADYRWFRYTYWLEKTNTNPQVGDLIDTAAWADGGAILGLHLEDR